MGVLDPDLIYLQENLVLQRSLKKRVEILKNFAKTRDFLEKFPDWAKVFSLLSLEEKNIVFSLIAIDQGERIFGSANQDQRQLSLMLKQLLQVEYFYKDIGGIVGYHITCLQLLAQKNIKEKKGIYHCPVPLQIGHLSPSVKKEIIYGIQNLPFLAEIYPVGGAADRLSLRDEVTGAFQIAATLTFAQKTLLEWLIDDLQAKEFLYWKLFKQRIHIPVVLMTSDEKNGTEHLSKLLKEKDWFGKAKNDFFLFSQPLVPTMNKKGEWCLKGPCQLLLKPGGHGVIWKLAKESGALDWLKEKGKSKALMRQINNLVAGVDYALFAFLGVGFRKNKKIGFASCPRVEGVSEGANVLIETQEGFTLTNIEYCDQDHFQLEEKSLLANTNLLFVDLQTIEDLLPFCPIPGMLVNAKKMKYTTLSGECKEEEILRLESMMQNIADALVEKEKMKSTFITQNERRKTISTIKREFDFNSSFLQTPEQCFLDLLENARDLLVNHCEFEVPTLPDLVSFVRTGPSFVFLYHPSLGPLYEIIQQKIKRGIFGFKSELRLHITDIYVENLVLNGSLHIKADAIMGQKSEEGVISFNDRSGKCVLKNIQIRNKGIHWEATHSYWKNEVIYKEKCEIILEEGAEFFAENVVFEGNCSFHVPRGKKMIVQMLQGEIKIQEENLFTSSWYWKYSLKNDSIVLDQEQIQGREKARQNLNKEEVCRIF